jgi:hypothetical protein
MNEQNLQRMGVLVEEYREQRVALKLMILDLNKIKEKIETLFPETIDKRYIMYFEQKVKSATGIFFAILEIRKEISKNIKDEMEMIRKIDPGGAAEDDLSDISEIAYQVESLQKESLKMIGGGKNG